MNIPKSTFIKRVEEAQSSALQMGLNALVVYSTGSSLGFASRTHGYIRYLCGWDSRNQAAIMVLVPGMEPVLLVIGQSSMLFAKEQMWFKDVRAVHPDGFGKEIVKILQNHFRSGDRIGYIGKSETPAPLYDFILKGLKNVQLIEVNQIIDEKRVVKDEMSIDFHRKSAIVCDCMFDLFCSEVTSGKKIYQIQADLEHKAKIEGCEYASSFMSIGPVADRPRYSKQECMHIPEEGDQILLSLFVLKDGHWGHSIRTGYIGGKNPKLEETHNIVLQMQDAMLKKITPGNPISSLWLAAEDILNKYYPQAREQGWYWLKVGHSLGLDYSDPILSDFFPNPFSVNQKISLPDRQYETFQYLTPGMLFEFHPNLFVPGYASAAIGNMVLATSSGFEILDQYPRSLISV